MENTQEGLFSRFVCAIILLIVILSVATISISARHDRKMRERGQHLEVVNWTEQEPYISVLADQKGYFFESYLGGEFKKVDLTQEEYDVMVGIMQRAYPR